MKHYVILQPIKNALLRRRCGKIWFHSVSVFVLTRVFFSWFSKVHLETWSRRSIHHLLTFCVLTKVRQTERRCVEDGGWQNSPWTWRKLQACRWTSGSSCLLAGLFRVSRCPRSRMHLNPSHRSPQTPSVTGSVNRQQQVTDYTQQVLNDLKWWWHCFFFNLFGHIWIIKSIFHSCYTKGAKFVTNTACNVSQPKRQPSEGC